MSASYKNIARVIKVQGRKGEVVVAALRGLPFCLKTGMKVALTPPALNRERFSLVLSCVEEKDNTGRVCFSCAHDISTAEAIVGCSVLAAAADLHLGPLDVALDSLIGRVVVSDTGVQLGSIKEILETPANDVWVVSSAKQKEILLPIIPEVVKSIPEMGPIQVHLLHGLLD